MGIKESRKGHRSCDRYARTNHSRRSQHGRTEVSTNGPQCFPDERVTQVNGVGPKTRFANALGQKIIGSLQFRRLGKRQRQADGRAAEEKHLKEHRMGL